MEILLQSSDMFQKIINLLKENSRWLCEELEEKDQSKNLNSI